MLTSCIRLWDSSEKGEEVPNSNQQLRNSKHPDIFQGYQSMGKIQLAHHEQHSSYICSQGSQLEFRPGADRCELYNGKAFRESGI